MILLTDDRLDLRIDRRSRSRRSEIKYTCRQLNVGPFRFCVSISEKASKEALEKNNDCNDAAPITKEAD